MIFGLILAGGRSSRLGREKAVEPFGGQPTIGWVARAIACGTVRQAVNAPDASGAAAFARARGWPILPDAADAIEGPLAGVAAGLRWAEANGATWLATSPCDTPLVPHDLVARLAQRCGTGGAFAGTASGDQPLCALWPLDALPMIETLREHPPIRSVLRAIGAIEVEFEPDAFANLNTREDFRKAKADLHANGAK